MKLYVLRYKNIPSLLFFTQFTTIFMNLLTFHNIHNTLHWFFRIMYDVQNTIFDACLNQHNNQQSACDVPRHLCNCKWKFRIWSCRVKKKVFCQCEVNVPVRGENYLLKKWINLHNQKVLTNKVCFMLTNKMW